MLLRDLLVALPGLIGPTGSPSRVQDIEVQEAPQIVSPAIMKAPAQAATLPDPGSSRFMEQALKDYYEQTGFQPPVTPTPTPPPPKPEPEPQPQPEPQPEPEPQPQPEPEPPVTGTPLPLRVDTLTADAGRVLTIEPTGSGAIAGVKILSQTSHGHVSVNPDNSLSLVLSENPGTRTDTDFRYQITYANGRTQEVQAKVDVRDGQEPEGWGQGDFYMLETGADGRVVVEHGENHRKIHVTEGAHGLTRVEIAKAEGVAASTVTAKWLEDHPEYGATPDKALDTTLGMELWYASTGRNAGPNSNWLLFERGYQYEDLGRIVNRGANGESALNPTFIGAYGQGHDPKIDGTILIFQDKVSHIVIQGLDTTGITALGGDNLLLDQLSVKGNHVNIQNITGFTLRDSDIADVIRSAPVTNDKVWAASANRISGAYLSNVDGAYVDNNLFDRNGWVEGYDYNLSISKPMPPSYYSHNLYVQSDVTDITVRDNIFMRGASFGAQVRPGGVIEGNTFLDNNAAVNFFSGYNYTLVLDNIVTSAGYKKVAHYQGALSIGIDGQTKMAALIGNIVAHRADPANAAEKAAKIEAHFALAKNPHLHVDDTIVYNWAKEGKLSTNSTTMDRNVAGLNAAVLDQTTIQKFTADLLGKKTATISDLANYLRAQADGKLDGTVDADVINAFFREGFGLDTALRAQAQTLRFVPDDRADGLRWDNRLNWSTEDLPGTQDGDSVNLGGNRVLFSAETVAVDDFIFGNFGQLKATSGRLDIEGAVSTARTGNLLQIDNAGQIWVDGYRDSDLLAIDLAGGRFANTGAFAGETIIGVSDDAQLLLATSGGRFDLAGGSSLAIAGSKAKVGFDGSDGKTATLHLHDTANLSFVATASGLGKISEFHSGAFETSRVTSGVRLDGDLTVDLSALDRKSGGTWTLIDVDQMIGSFDDIAVTGLGNNRDALIRLDYIKDEVVLLVSDAGKGSGQIRTATTGDADFIDHSQDAALKALWASLHAAMPQVTDDPL